MDQTSPSPNSSPKYPPISPKWRAKKFQKSKGGSGFWLGLQQMPDFEFTAYRTLQSNAVGARELYRRYNALEHGKYSCIHEEHAGHTADQQKAQKLGCRLPINVDKKIAFTWQCSKGRWGHRTVCFYPISLSGIVKSADTRQMDDKDGLKFSFKVKAFNTHTHSEYRTFHRRRLLWLPASVRRFRN